MKSVFVLVATLISLVFFLQSCTYDKEMLLPASNSADTVNVSFAASILPLLRANCFSCHGNGSNLGNCSVDTYDDVKALAVSGRLLGSISHSAGFAPMPLGADKLDNSSIDAVRIWIDEGTRNN
jgi:mono/diheme cytochrome c family protein